MEKMEPCIHTVGGNVNFYGQYGKQNGSSSRNLKIELLYNSTIPLMNIYISKEKNSILVRDTLLPYFHVHLRIFTKPKYGNNLTGSQQRKDSETCEIDRKII